MKMKIVGLLTVMFLTGCSSMGGEDKFSATYVTAHLIPHKTTQAQVQAIYGVPDEQTTYSGGGYGWRYFKNGNLSDAQGLAGIIPGAGVVSSALSSVGYANQASHVASTAAGKVNGDTEHHGNNLSISFDKNKVVSDWSL